MKLTDLSIDGYGVCRDLRLNQFNNGLNIVFGSTGAGKTTVRNFIRGVLYGFDSQASSRTNPDTAVSGGNLEISHNDARYRLLRDIRLSGNLNLQPISPMATVPTTVHGVDQLTGDLSASFFDTFFNICFHDTRELSFNVANAMHTRLAVPLGKVAIRDETAFLNWQRETDLLKSQMGQTQQRIDSLTVEKRGYQQQMDQAHSLRDTQLAAIDRQLSEIEAQIASISTVPVEEDIVKVRAEIARLRDLIANAEVQYVPTTPAPTTMPVVTTHSALYQRLDEIDNQIRRWRRVQSDVQNQRLRLRDEMLVWNDMTMDSPDHPYHNSREILVSLESKVQATLKHADDGQSVRALCTQIQEDIANLCDELGHQYKHIRHRAAAAELKQLRRCYNEMGENTDRLLSDRNTVISEIRGIDPAGAEAIQRADHAFCQFAQQEGYLEARRRFVGEVPSSVPVATIQPQFTAVRPNLDAQRTRLRELEVALGNSESRLDLLNRQRTEHQLKHSDLVSQRDRLLAQNYRADLLAKINNVDVELRRLTDEYNSLSKRLNSLHLVETPPNPILERAGQCLSQMSLGDLGLVWLGDQPGEIMVQNRFDQAERFDSLSRGQKDQVLLSLCLGVADSLQRQGIKGPMLLDDVFANIDQQRVTATLEVLKEHGRRGNQVVAFAKANEVTRPMQSVDVTVYELPQTGVSTRPFSLPERQTSFPARDVSWESNLAELEQPFYRTQRVAPRQFDATEVYPFAKYPRTTPMAPVTPALFDPKDDFESPVVKVKPVEFPQRTPAPAPVLDEVTLISQHAVVDLSSQSVLNELGVNQIGELFELDSDVLPANYGRAGISAEQIERWQIQYWLMTAVPGLNSTDAKVLFACGINDPEQLDTLHEHQLLERVQRFLNSSEGRAFRGKTNYSPIDISQWYRSLDSNRHLWSQSSRRQKWRSRVWNRQAKSQRERAPRDYDREPRRRTETRESATVAEPKRTQRSARNRSEFPTTPMVQSFNERHRTPRSESRTTSKASDSSSEKKLKFYLDLTDHIEAAPSIGNRTAERFEKIGVHTVADFLRQTSESMASKLNYKRITAEVVREWQLQTRLVCRVPNLRGHDAQLLVACGITEPEDLSAMQPSKLFDIIGPFSETKQGLKIIRSGKKPDLDEIKDWIDWASHTRSLQAA